MLIPCPSSPALPVLDARRTETCHDPYLSMSLEHENVSMDLLSLDPHLRSISSDWRLPLSLEKMILS